MSTRLTLPLTGPGGEPIDLWRTMNSHGFAELAPTRARRRRTNARAHAAHATWQTTTCARSVRAGRTAPSSRSSDRPRVLRVQLDVVAGVRRVLRLDHDLSGFYAKAANDPDLAWAATGAGRMLQGPTVFEDVVKTVCTTNCAWSATRPHGERDGRASRRRGDRRRAGRSPTRSRRPRSMAGTPRGVLSRRGPRRAIGAPYIRSLARSVADGDARPGGAGDSHAGRTARRRARADGSSRCRAWDRTRPRTS